MRRLLNEARSYARGPAGAAIRRGWDAFFFTPADPTALGLIRVATGLLAFWSLLVLGLDLHDYFGSDGWAEPAAVRAAQRSLAWSFWFLVPDGGLRLAWLVCLVVLALFTLGLFSRMDGGAGLGDRGLDGAAGAGGAVRIRPGALAAGALPGGDGGRAARRSRWTGSCGDGGRRGRRPGRRCRAPLGGGRPARRARRAGECRSPTVSANLSLRLIQLHLVVIYGMAGLGKLQGPSWWNGMALWGTMTAGEFVVLDFTPMARWPLLINFLTHVSLALELLYPILIWIRITRPLDAGRGGGDAPGDRRDEPGPDRIHPGDAGGEPGVRPGVVAAAARGRPGSAALCGSSSTGPARGAAPRWRWSRRRIPAALVEPIDLTAVDVRSVHPALTPEACLRAMHVV